MEPELFETKITDQGKDLLTRINSWARVFYIATIISAILDIVVAILSIKLYIKYSSTYPNDTYFFEIFNIIYLMMYAVLLPIAGYFLYRFSGSSKKALIASNTTEWNNSLNWLLKHVKFGATLFILNCFWAITNSIYYFIIARDLHI